MDTGPGIIVNAPKTRQGGVPGRARRRSSRRSTVQLAGSPDTGAAHGVESIDVERLSYINTALEAVPGMTLRRFFAPVMRVHCRLMTRSRASKLRLAKYMCNAENSKPEATKAFKEAMNQLCAALTTAAADVIFDAPMNIDATALAELLEGKLEAVSYAVEDALSLPCEPAEAAFVYVVLNGSVRVTHYQQQLRRPALAAPANSSGDGGIPVTPSRAAERKQFFTSSDEVFHLCTSGGIHVGLDGMVGGDADAAAAEAGTVIVGNNASNLNSNDAVSVSNVTTAIQRSLRKASRAVGQPTLQATRTEVLRAPCVLGAAEALGLAPGRCASCFATATAIPGGKAPAAATGDGAHNSGSPFGVGGGADGSPGNTGGSGGGIQYVEYTDVLRVRALDLHAALVELARREMEARGGCGEWLSAPLGGLPPRGVPRTLGDYIAAARAKALTTYFPQSEMLMRQSWLLQDTPAATLRNLISRLTPRTYMPGEVIACPHLHSTAARQLCFLRRGRLLIMAAPPTVTVNDAFGSGHRANHNRTHEDTLLSGDEALNGKDAGAGYGARGCDRCACNPCPRVLEVVHAGTSFGELSVLFGEARSYTLVADSVCDVWCLPHADFARTMRRDDTLRATLVEKAAALRIKWLAEQRFTPALAEHLRSHSEMFRPFCDVVLRLLQERVEPVVYSPGQLITSTSERCQEMIFIMQGSVESICEGVAAYGPGDVLGEGCLVAHRWPLGLAARTMVEGWRLPRDRLVDALERADILHAHSGEVTSQAPVLMKQVFQPPVPEVESDVVGRLRMPVVGPAPGGLSYAAFARRMAEVQLKALCFTYRDYVKWEDINYASMDRGMNARELLASDALARDFAIARMRGSTAPPLNLLTAASNAETSLKGKDTATRPSTGLHQQRRSTVAGVTAAATTTAPAGSAGAGRLNTTVDGAAAGSGRSAASRLSRDNRAASAPGGGTSARSTRKLRAVRKTSSGAGAFLVNASVLAAPFTRRPANGKCSSPREAQQQQQQRDSQQSMTSAATLPTSEEQQQQLEASAAVRNAHKLPPRLRSLTHTLGERDRVLNGEMREEAELERKLAAQQRATVKEHLAARTAPAVRAMESANTGVGDPAANTVLAAVAAKVPVPSSLLVADPVPFTEPMPPVHVFLSGERPRTEMTMAEALSIGYVVQLPDSHSIQACVSFVDPDVTVGPPAQRGRRHAMATTPNDRHHKHNFLFAAAVFENISKLEEQLQGMREEEQLKKTKAQKLMTMLRANVNSSRWHGDKADANNHRDALQQDALLTPGDESPSRDRSPMNSVSRTRSPSGAAAMVSPMRQASSFLATAGSGRGSGAGRMLTPSPFRGSPGKGSLKREEAFERLLKREPAKAVDMLCAKYQLAPVAAASPLFLGGGPSQPQFVLNASLENDAGGRGANDSTATANAAQPRGRPSLLARLRDAGRDRPCSPHETVDDHEGDGVGGVQMTNAGVPALELPVANYRDRHRAQVSYLNTVDRQFVGVYGGANPLGSPQSLSTSALLLGAALPATLETHLTQRKDSVLFVDDYGALDVSPEALAGGSVVLAPASHVTKSGSPSEDGDGEADGSRLRRQRGLSRTATATFASGSISAASLGGPLTPQDFVMPDLDDANAVMRRIQRDVEGLNAVAKEQARMRRAAREKERQLGAKHVQAAAAALAHPSADEAQTLEDWQQVSHLLSRDPIQPMVVPDALRPQAGPDYLRRGVEEVNQAVAAEAAREAAASGVAAWQEEQLISSTSGSTPARPAQGGRQGGNLNPATPGADDPAAAKRTIAAIGTGQLGYRVTPLVAPTQIMDQATYERYVQDRESFFDAFKRNPKAVLTGNLIEPQLPQGFESLAGGSVGVGSGLVAAYPSEAQLNEQQRNQFQQRGQGSFPAEEVPRFAPWS